MAAHARRRLERKKTAGFGNAQFCSEPARQAKFELTTSALRAALYPASPHATNKAD